MRFLLLFVALASLAAAAQHYPYYPNQNPYNTPSPMSGPAPDHDQRIITQALQKIAAYTQKNPTSAHPLLTYVRAKGHCASCGATIFILCLLKNFRDSTLLYVYDLSPSDLQLFFRLMNPKIQENIALISGPLKTG